MITRRQFSALPLFCLPPAFTLAQGSVPVWKFKSEFWPELIRAIPSILANQDAKSGRFGEGIWIANDQNVIFPLAVAWGIPHSSNPYYHREDVLEAIMAGGDALINDQDENGQWMFRKKDGSTWGKISQPWTYTRWIRAFHLIREGMPAPRRARWEKALLVGYEYISKHQLTHVHNMPAHHAMGLYQAGQVFNRQDWCQQASSFMRKVAASQNPGGYWPEHLGPAVLYNFVYSEAIGSYYQMSGDTAVLPCLNRAARFHANFTYPDGRMVETIDGRNPYHPGIRVGTPGFTFSPQGRSAMLRQWRALLRTKENLPADEAASFILHGEEGPLEVPVERPQPFRAVLGDGDAIVQQRDGWFFCLSALTRPIPPVRWGQDRQAMMSLFHDSTGVIVTGSNTKLQPQWSTFTVGDTSLLYHRPGDIDPKFLPPPGLYHVPTKASLVSNGNAVALTYGEEECRLDVEVRGPKQTRLVYSTAERMHKPVEAHVTLLPHFGEKWRTASGREGVFDKEPVWLGPGESGAWFEHHGWRISIPPEATVSWPVEPHNPYRKDGFAGMDEGMLVAVLPFSEQTRRYELTVDVI